MELSALWFDPSLSQIPLWLDPPLHRSLSGWTHLWLDLCLDSSLVGSRSGSYPSLVGFLFGLDSSLCLALSLVLSFSGLNPSMFRSLSGRIPLWVGCISGLKMLKPFL